METDIQDIIDYRSYLGNVNLKRKGVAIDWTQEMVQEFVKCAKDPIYFAEKYIQIVHVDHGLIPIVCYDYQKEIIKKTTDNRRVCVVTSRQAGKTTTAVCLILHYILFNDHKLVALLANKGDAAREILDRIKTAYEALPKWLQQGVIEWNKGSVEFENGSKIIAAATSSSAIRGKSVSFLYIDETAFVENWDEFFASVFPTISSGTSTKILLTSTPNGLNHFYKTCEGAKAGKNGYEFVQVMWTDVPGRDQKWYDETLAAMDFDTEKFAQEMECEFLGSSGTLIAGWKLKQLVYKEAVKEVGGIIVYEEPKSEGNYVIVVDVSRGKGLDYSAFQVIDISQMPYVQVGAYRNNMITPVDYAAAVHAAAKYFNDANILVEVNDIGEQVSSIIFEEYEYENMLLTENNGREGKRLLSGVAGFSGKADKGIRTTKSVKSIGCSMIKLLVEQNQLIINDFETIREMSTFSQKGTSYEAEPGNHDDLMMCLVLFGWLSNQRFFKELTDINTVINLKEMNEEKVFSELVPFGIIDDGQNDFEDPKPVTTRGNDLSWLL
jgi:phage terminase large subunit-like protein